LTSALDGSEWSAAHPGHFTLGPQSQSGHGSEEKNSQTLPGLEPPII